jgi:predicted dehydrogenase
MDPKNHSFINGGTRLEPIIFNIVGGGWRTEFYLRIAQALPDRFQIGGIVVRDQEKGAALKQKWGIPTFQSLDVMLNATKPSFTVVSVSRDAAPAFIQELAQRGVPVLCETPPAPDLAGLNELYRLAEGGAKIQVAEQYQFQPLHAARIQLVNSGKLGEISQVQISSCHDYHAVSLIRNLLGVGFAEVTISAHRFNSRIVQGPDHLGGLDSAEKLTESEQIMAFLDFDGKVGVYDFCYDQYFSWIRALRMLVRGSHGEIENTSMKYLKDFQTPIDLQFLRQDAGDYGNLEGWHHKGILAGEEWVYRNPFIPGRLSDDEIAIATCLQKMEEHVMGGPAFYGLGDAAQDHYLSLLINEAAETGRIIRSETQRWTGPIKE